MCNYHVRFDRAAVSMRQVAGKRARRPIKEGQVRFYRRERAVRTRPLKQMEEVAVGNNGQA